MATEGTKVVALVTGSNKGIGFAIVRGLCKELGERGVVYLSARDEGRGQKAVDDLKGEGLNPKFIQLDICNNDHISRVTNYFRDHHGGLDILVNNAAIAFKAASKEPDSVQAPVTIETNLFATHRLCQALIPLIRSHGRVVNIASQGGTFTYARLSPELKKRFQSATTEQDVVNLMNEFISVVKEGKQKERGWSTSNYETSKLGLITLTKILGQNIAKDSSREGILINASCPGHCKTDLSSHQGDLTIDQGAITPVYLALLPKGSTQQGLFIHQKAVLDFW